MGFQIETRRKQHQRFFQERFANWEKPATNASPAMLDQTPFVAVS